MSKIALLWLAIYFGGVILTLIRHPIYGLLTYLFEYFNHPSSYWWGADLPDFRWSFFIALVTLVSLIIRWHQFKEVKAPSFKWFLAFLLVAAVVTYTTAVSVKESQSCLEDLIKLAILYFLIVKIVQSEREYRLFVWAIILGCFLFGWRAYQDPNLQGGRLESLGGVDTSSANALASLMLIPLPFIGFYFFTGKKWERVLSVVVAPFILNTIILCNSRGVFLGLLATAAIVVLPGLRILKLKFVLMLLLGVMLFVRLVDQRFIDRMMHIKSGSEQELKSESLGRVASWRGGWKLMRDHPFGTGGKGYKLLSPIYISEIVEAHGGEFRSPHNTFINVGSEWGFPGLFLWLAFLGSTLWHLHRLRRKPHHSGNRYAIESIAIQSALLGFLVAGIFTDRSYAEALYWLCAMGASLWQVSEQAEQTVAKPVQSHDLVTDNIVQWIVRHQIRKARKKIEESME
jgi:O-antigen ligase